MSHLFMCFVALDIQGGAMAKFGHCTTTNNVWERIGENTWHSLWERGRVNPIFLLNAGWDVS